MKKVVVDTNVFISALTGSNVCKQIIVLFRRGEFRLVISEEIILELEAVLRRPKFDLEKHTIDIILRYLNRKTCKVISFEKIFLCRDKKDNIVLECAAATKVDFIVTGDKDLLSLKSFRKISIITPREFLIMF